MTAPSLSCPEVLALIEADPLNLPAGAEAHARSCPACSEARVAWLAMEDADPALAPAGYFDHLPGRVLRKLPGRPSLGSRRSLLWGLAAAMLVAVGAGGFYLGRVNRQPLVEATLQPAPQELPSTLPDAPFVEGDDVMTQLKALSPEEAKALMDRLDSKETKR